jgi:hypothetical protein
MRPDKVHGVSNEVGQTFRARPQAASATAAATGRAINGIMGNVITSRQLADRAAGRVEQTGHSHARSHR